MLLLRHWLPMTSTLFGIVRISHSLFKGNYIRYEKLFLFFWSIYGIFMRFQTFSKKKKIVIANVFRKLQTVKGLVGAFSKKAHFRSSFQSQYVKWSQTVLKLAWGQFHQIFLSLWEKIIWKISPLLKFEILGVFVNTLTVDDKYPVRDCGN